MPMRGSRGGGGRTGGLDLPLKSYKNIGFLSIIGPDLLKIIIVPSQLSMLGHCLQMYLFNHALCFGIVLSFFCLFVVCCDQ